MGVLVCDEENVTREKSAASRNSAVIELTDHDVLAAWLVVGFLVIFLILAGK